MFVINYLSNWFTREEQGFKPLAMDVVRSVVIVHGKEIPKEILLQIFSHLNCLELTRCAEVNKREWRPIANEPLLLKNALYQEKLCTPKHLGLDSSFDKYGFESLPSDIVETYKKLGKNYYFIWQPKGIGYNTKGYKALEKILLLPIINNAYVFPSKLRDIKNSWILVPKEIDSDFRPFTLVEIQKKIDASYKKDLDNCEVPSILEVIFILNSLFIKTGKMLFQDPIMCKEYEFGSPFRCLVIPGTNSIKMEKFVFQWDVIHYMGIRRLA